MPTPFIFRRRVRVLYPCRVVPLCGMASLQGGVYAFVLICPIHFALVMANLLYIHYFNVVDHSGIYLESRFPWQARHPSSTSS